jgi:CRP/FNR family cyclic AMP-dependent transcriptional regulator
MSNDKSLKELPIFSSLTDDEIKAVSEICSTQTFSANELVFSEGDPGNVLYLIVVGSVRIYTKITENVDKTLVTLRKGGLFGEMSVVSEDYRSATARAVEASELLAINQNDFKALLDKNPCAGKKILEFIVKVLADRLKNTTDLYRQAVDWGISISGILELNYNQLISQKQKMTIDLNSGKNVTGVLLKAEKHSSGLELLLKTDSDNLVIIPYAAISSISFGAGAAKQQ